MRKYLITQREYVFIDHIVEVPDDCDDPLQYFYDLDSEAQALTEVGRDCSEWDLDVIEEIIEGKN
jgi:hypothetical protein